MIYAFLISAKIRLRVQQPMQLPPHPQPPQMPIQSRPQPPPQQPPPQPNNHTQTQPSAPHCQMVPPPPCQGGVPSVNPYAETNYSMQPLPPPAQTPQLSQMPTNPGSPSLHSMPGSPMNLPPSPVPATHRLRYNDPYQPPYDMYGNVDYGMSGELPQKQPGKKAVLPKEVLNLFFTQPF